MKRGKNIICRDILTDENLEVEIEHGVIVSERKTRSEKSNLFIGPGFTDLQVNGFAGVDFNEIASDSKEIIRAIDQLRKCGVTLFFPTVITNSPDATRSILRRIDQICSEDHMIEKHIGGIHLEGPFISPEKGAVGAHNKDFVTAPDWDLFQSYQRASGNRIKLITMSPEWPDSAAFIEKCVDSGIKVSLGHTVATPQEVKVAVEAGASLSTHLGNAAPLHVPRNNNFIYEQMADDRLFASVIADGFHLPESFLKIVMRMKKDKALLISDCTRFAGMKPGIYHTHIGGKVILNENGRLAIYQDEEYLAGSAVSLLDCVNYLLKSGLCELETAWKMASVYPNQFMGLIPRERVILERGEVLKVLEI